MKLHIISENLGREKFIELCAQRLGDKDQILFIAEGVTALLQEGLVKLNISNKISALNDDCTCRGIASQMPEWIQLIDMAQMVSLCDEAKQVVSW